MYDYNSKDPEYNDYDDDDHKNYPEEYNEHGYPNSFKIDWGAWEEWLSDAIKDIYQTNDSTWIIKYNTSFEDKSKKFPVSDSTPSGTSKDQYFMYLGSNHYSEGLWKTKYFINDKLEQEYKNHTFANAAHVLKQPNHYKGMFDILN